LHNAVEQTHYHDDLLFPARLVRNILEGNLEEMDTLTTFFVVSKNNEGKSVPIFVSR